jgi:glycosyltransferase involved in cell wall biosynthesis
MKILIIHQNFVDNQHPGGTRHFELAKHLQSRGHEVTIVAGNVDYLTGKVIVPTRWGMAVQQMDGVRVLRAYTYPSLHRSFKWRVFSFLTFMVTSILAGLRAGRADLVMGTSPPIFQLPSAWLVAVLTWRPFLLEVRDLWPEFAIDMGILRNPMLIRAARWVERFFYGRATHIVVNSPAYRDYLVEKKQIPPGKVTLVANGVDCSMFDPAARGEEVRAQFGWTTEFVATYAGALGQANDLPTLLRAAAHLRDDPHIRIFICGGGKEEQNLRGLAQEMKLTNVTFGGAFPKQRMREVLAASDVCIALLQNIPMFSTTYPNKVFDYMAAGRPTVLGIDGVIRDVMESARGGVFVPPGNDRLLADAIRQLAGDPATARQMGEAARRHVEMNFERGKQADSFAAMLEQLV